ncbi:cytochrome P450 [Infundibulicybe gibba]|nr:cytochrome P450 [Infundibulicybe gibba]
MTVSVVSIKRLVARILFTSQSVLSTSHAMSYTLLAGAVLVLIFLKHLSKTRTANPNKLPYPPGPKGLPFIGNLLDIPTERQWLVYMEWAKTYGDIIHFKIFNQSFVILNSLKRTTDLFDKRSSAYSSRPRMPMLVELMNWDIIMPFLPYGSAWRARRRLFHEHFHMGVIEKYRPIQARESRRFLQRLLDTPENFMHHIRHAFSAVIMDIAYGIKVEDANDPYTTIAEESLEGLAAAGVAGTFLVDLIPILKYVPPWMPGAGFRRKAAYWRSVNHQLTDKPWAAVQENIRKGWAPVSLAAILIDNLPNDERRAEEEEVAKSTAAVAYAGGADTTLSSVQTFFLAMAMYPDAQRKAQAEIDAVVGPSRLPEFADRKSLPYVNALMKETMRWKNVLPLAVAHSSVEDDEYDGYFIPKGAIVIGNTWAILHDSDEFPEPEEFRPERYLTADGSLNEQRRDPQVAAFGYGRRICPGRHLSDSSLYSYVSMVLATFDITPPPDANGEYVKIEGKMTSGMLCYPEPFGCVIKPRSMVAEKLIRESQYAD